MTAVYSFFFLMSPVCFVSLGSNILQHLISSKVRKFKFFIKFKYPVCWKCTWMGNLEETNMYIKVYKWVNYLWQPTLEQ